MDNLLSTVCLIKLNSIININILLKLNKMKTVYHCIRCQKETFNGIALSNSQVKIVKELTLINLVEIEYKNIVCTCCRYYIGDEIADQMLKIFET